MNDVESPAGRKFDLFIQLLVIISVLSFCLETLPNLSQSNREILSLVEITTITIFTIEYILRLVVSQPFSKYPLSFFGIVDLIAILPFYIATIVDLRAVRIVRLIRLLQLFKLARYNKAIRRYVSALISIKEELVICLVACITVIFLASIGIYFFENESQPENFSSVFHSMWWAVATLTTVGYGDVYPVTIGGKLFTFVILMAGLGLISVPSGLMASAFTESRQQK